MRGAIALGFLLCVSASAGCDGDPFWATSCTEIGCGDGVSMQLRLDERTAMTTTSVLLSMDGVSSRCELEHPADLDQFIPCGEGVEASLQRTVVCESTTAPNGDESESCRPDGGFALGLTVFGTPQLVAMELTPAGGEARSFTVQPRYETTRPNGPDCDPVCRRADIELSFDDGQVASLIGGGPVPGAEEERTGAGTGLPAQDPGIAGDGDPGDGEGDVDVDGDPGECVVATRLDACCFEPLPVRRAELAEDACLVELTDLGRARLDGTDADCGARSECLGVLCGLIPTTPRTAAPSAAGECQLVDECETDADCVIADDASLCCSCTQGYPRSVVEAASCIGSSDASTADACSSICTTACEAVCEIPHTLSACACRLCPWTSWPCRTWPAWAPRGARRPGRARAPDRS